ncbi:MAG: hypothetical protein ACJ73N_15100 [Bryobacteraceae bacterium]
MRENPRLYDGYRFARSNHNAQSGWTGNSDSPINAADTASYQDHTLLLNKSLTENLPAYPVIGQEFYLANIGSSSVTISGNGKNIWSAGTNSASITLASNATAILQFDGTLWHQIK